MWDTVAVNEYIEERTVYQLKCDTTLFIDWCVQSGITKAKRFLVNEKEHLSLGLCRPLGVQQVILVWCCYQCLYPQWYILEMNRLLRDKTFIL